MKIKETSTHFENKSKLNEECNVIYAINLVKGQWVLMIVCKLSEEGKMRFNELKKGIPEITERMLTLQLRQMEENQLITRTVYAEVPPRVEYELTSIGKELMPVLRSLDEWGEKYKATIFNE